MYNSGLNCSHMNDKWIIFTDLAMCNSVFDDNPQMTSWTGCLIY